MNKKFFAALASATMAFSATGSLAVFAQDFEEENTPTLPTDQEKPAVAKKVVWNKDNFGDLVDNGKVFFYDVNDNSVTEPKLNEEIEVEKLNVVTTIALGATFKGEIKGLEYFSKLNKFWSNATANITNDSLDFSENTVMTVLTISNAPELSNIVLPNAEKYTDTTDGKEKEAYRLKALSLKNTALTSLDLSAQKGLNTITVSDGNLSSIQLRPATHSAPVTYGTLNLSNNAFETIDLEYYTFNTDLNLSGNRFGALDLSDTTAANAELNNQKFYVAKNAVSINLLDVFSLNVKDLDNINNITSDGKLETNDENKYTGVLKLAKSDSTNYNYNTKLKGAAADTPLTVTLQKENPMHRLYNPNSGEHFYTADFEEHDALVALGWNDEGYGWVAPKAEVEANAVYRLYNPNAGDHHYTMDVKEKNTLVSYGWKDEGIGWYSAEVANATKVDNTSLPVYRQYNPYANGAGSHNYTTDKAENDFLVSVGWTPEGTAWYGLK